MILKLNTQTREEFSAEIIEILKRKGWVELVKPEYDSLSKKCELINGEWVVSDLEPISHEDILSKGYTDVVTGIKLKASVADQTRYGLVMTLSNEAIAQGKMSGDTQQTIWDYDEKPHVLTTANLKELLVRYGFWCRFIYDNYS